MSSRLVAAACALTMAPGCGKSREAVADDPGGTKPAMPVIIAPANGTYTGSLRAATGSPRRPLFAWRPVSFEAPITYDIEIDDDCRAGELQRCAFGSPEARITGIAGTRWQPERPLPVSASPPMGRRYGWRMRACAGSRCSPWTRVRYLEVGRTRGDFNGDGFSDVAVGAPLVDNGGRDRGSVFIYYGRRGGLARGDRIDDPGREDDSNFGVAVAVAGDINGDGFDDLVVGAAGSNQTRGYAYAFYGSAAGIDAGGYTRLEDVRHIDDWFGASVAGAGDVDGDGFDDVIVGASGTNRRGREWGVAYVFRGHAEGVLAREAVFLGVQSASNHDHFGYAVAGAGDLDGDGYDEVAIGSPGFDAAGKKRGTDRGTVYVFDGSRDGVLRVPSARLEAPVPLDHDHFGYSVSCAGDVDRDGYADLIVGAPGADGTAEDSGTAYLFRGGSAGLSRIPAQVLNDSATRSPERFGTAVAGAGDIDGDGFDDLVIGSSSKRRGRAITFHASAVGLGPRPATVLEDPLGPGYNDFAEVVAGAGDIDGDGFDDLVIGASGSDNGGVYRGSVVIYAGSARGTISSKSLRIDDPDRGVHDHFGHGVAGR